MRPPPAIVTLLTTGLAVLLTAGIGSLRADEETEGSGRKTLRLHDGPIAVDVPKAWFVTGDPEGTWARAQDLEDGTSEVLLTRHPLRPNEEHDVVLHESGTVIVSRNATPPTRTLHLHELQDGERHTLRLTVPLTSERYRTIFSQFRDLRETPDTLPLPNPTGWPRHFLHEVPEAISFRGHAFLKVVEAAARKRTFSEAEAAAWQTAQDAWAETLRHAERLAEDRAYRAADRLIANVAHEPSLENAHLRFRWVEPYMLVRVSQEELEDGDRILDEQALVLTQVYRAFLARFGKALGLHDLMAPHGGGSDRVPRRSFPNGAPLLVLVFDRAYANSPVTWAPWFWRRLRAGRTWPGVDPTTGALELQHPTSSVDSPGPGWMADWDAGDAELAVRQLLWWFSRQRNRWNRAFTADNAVHVGAAAWLAGGSTGPSTLLAPRDPDGTLLAEMKALARQFAARGGTPYPFFPLERLLAFDSVQKVTRWSQSEFGVPGGVGVQLFHQQAWSFVGFLDAFEDGRYRDQLTALLGALLDREMEFGQSLPVAKRVLGLRTEEDWETLESAWRTWVTEDLWTRGAEAQPGPAQGDAFPPMAHLVVHVHANGTQRFEWAYSPYGRDWNLVGPYEGAETDVALRNLLRRLCDLPHVRQGGQPSRLDVVITADPGVSWDEVRNVIAQCARTNAAPQAIHVANVSSALDLLGRTEAPPGGRLEVIFRRDGDPPETRVQVTGPGLTDLRTTVPSDGLRPALEAVLGNRRMTGSPPRHARLRFLPPQGPFPPIKDVRHVVEILNVVGITRITVDSPAMHPDVEPEVAPPFEVTLRLTETGAVTILGPEGDVEIGPLPLADGTPAQQAAALRTIREVLLRVVANAPRESDGSSTAKLIVHGDRKARWQYLQWIMQLAADPRIRIYKIQFAVRKP